MQHENSENGKINPFKRDIVQIEKDQLEGRLHEAIVDGNGKVVALFIDCSGEEIDQIIGRINSGEAK